MPIQKNQEEVIQLMEKLDKATAVYFTDFLGLNVSSITELRSEFFKASIEYKVAKNTLLRLAAKKINLEGIDDFLVGSTAIAISYDEPSAPAKVLKKFTEDHDKPEVKAILFDGEVLKGSEYLKFASLPMKDVSLTKLVMMLNSPITILARTLSAPMINLINGLNNLKNNKS